MLALSAERALRQSTLCPICRKPESGSRRIFVVARLLQPPNRAQAGGIPPACMSQNTERIVSMKFNVQDYGALPNGTLCTKNLQKAIDVCFLSGGGEVTVPSGVYLTGGIRLRSNVTLHLLENAVLMGSIHPEDYAGYIDDPIEPIAKSEREEQVSTALPEATGGSIRPYSRWNNAIIRAIHAKNIAIIGEPGSELNGRNCFDPIGEEQYRGPHAINMWFCENIALRGYTVRDSANWAHAIQNSKDIDARNITVLGGHDGFDVRTCDNVAIEDCTFQTGDDCIAGFDNINVQIRNCYFESACSILRFGGTNVLVEDCRGFAPGRYAFRGSMTPWEKQNRLATGESHRRNCRNVFLYYCDYRAAIRHTPGNIIFRNCHFKNPDSIMRLPFGHKWCCNRSLADITFENCVFDGICAPMELDCPKQEPLKEVRLKDCTVAGREGFAHINFLTGTHIEKIELENVIFKNILNPEIRNDP